MLSPSPYPTTDGYHRNDDLAGGNEDLFRHPTVYRSFSPSTCTDDTPIQPIATRGQDTDTRGLSHFISPEVLGYGVPVVAPVLANVVQPPTQDLCPSPHGSDTETYHSHHTPSTGNIYHKAEVGPPIPQHTADPLPPPHIYFNTSDYTDSSILRSHENPHRDQAKGQLPGTSPIPNYGHDFYHTGTRMFLDPNGTYLPCPTEVRPSLFLEYPATPTIIHETDPSGDTDLSALGPPCMMENEETTGLSSGSPKLGTDNIKSRDPRKKGRVKTQNGLSVVKRTRRGRSQRLGALQAPIWAAPYLLTGRPNFRRVPQVPYESGNQQNRWTKLPDIDFWVKDIQGIKLTDAMDEYFSGPEGRDDLMFTNGEVGSSVSCRIIFHGYQLHGKSRQIVTTNHRRIRERITKKKLACEIAKRIENCLKELKDHKPPFPFRFEDMVLTKFIHVGKASWQPEIWYQIAPSTGT